MMNRKLMFLVVAVLLILLLASDQSHV